MPLVRKIAIIGTQGIPARYGGFETLVENLIDHRSENIEYTVFCSSKDIGRKSDTYKGCRLRYIPLSANGIQSIPYDILSMLGAIRHFDTWLILGVSGCMALPLLKIFYRNRIVVNIDGLEHRRAKWGRFAKWFLRKSEAMAVKYADAIIADNKGIQDYVTEQYGKPSVLIGYGGDHAIKRMSENEQHEILGRFGLTKHGYAITVCRIEPENNCHIILEAFSATDKKLLFIGNWDRSEYGRSLKQKYGVCSNIILQSPIYDTKILYALRNNAETYVHGHSAGGTNPSLVEAMFFGRPVLAYDVIYNRATTDNKAAYFKDVAQLSSLLSQTYGNGCNDNLNELARKEYTWKHITELYETIY